MTERWFIRINLVVFALAYVTIVLGGDPDAACIAQATIGVGSLIIRMRTAYRERSRARD